MRTSISIVWCFFSSFFISYAQDVKPKDLIFNEVNLALNRSFVSNSNTSDGFGFNVGLYRSFLKSKFYNPIVGIDYNLNTQQKENIIESKVRFTNLNYQLHYLTLPVGMRFLIGKKVKLIISSGVYLDILLSARYSGKKHYRNPVNNIEQSEDFSNIKLPARSLNPGVFAGLGIVVPIKSIQIIFFSEYRFGILTIQTDNTPFYNRFVRFGIGIRR